MKERRDLSEALGFVETCLVSCALDGPLLPGHGLKVGQGMDWVVVWEAVGAGPRGRWVVAGHGWLNQVLLEGDGDQMGGW